MQGEMEMARVVRNCNGVQGQDVVLTITRAGIQGLGDDFNSTIIFKVLTRSLRSTQYGLT